MSKTWIYIRILQIIIDFLGIFGSFLLAYFVRVGWIFSTDFPFTLFLKLSLLGTSIWIGFLLFSKYYRIPIRSGKRAMFDIGLILLGGIVANGFLIVSYFFPRDILFSRLISIYIFVFGTLFLLISQYLFRLVLATLKKNENKVYHTLVIGANRVAEKIIESFQKDKYAPHKIEGVIDPYGLEKTIKGSTILGKLNKLEDVCVEKKITCIVQCDGFEHTLNLISFCEEKDIKYMFLPALRGIFDDNLRIRETAGQTCISFVKRDYDKKTRKFKFKIIDAILRQVFDVN